MRAMSFAAALLGAVVSAAPAAGSDSCPPPQLALGRPHTDFVQWQVVPGRVLGPTNSLPGVKGTPLSYDAKGTRAVTVLFEFPAGWSMDRPHYVNSDQEFLVLAGELEIDGTTYRPGDYAYFPAGHEHQLLRSRAGATLLNFYEGEHLAFYEAAPAGLYQPGKLIRKLDTSQLRWRKARGGGWQKRLRQDRATGEETWLFRGAALAIGASPRGAIESRAAVEEFFLIDGDLSTPRGVMKPGAYAWRAPNTVIGPVASRTGYTALLRSKGGRPGGLQAKSVEPVDLQAPYLPCIPDSLRNAITPKPPVAPAPQSGP